MRGRVCCGEILVILKGKGCVQLQAKGGVDKGILDVD